MHLTTHRRQIFTAMGFAMAILLTFPAAAKNKPEPGNFGLSAPARRADQDAPTITLPFGLAEARMLMQIGKDIGLSEATLSEIEAAWKAEKLTEAEASKEDRAAMAALNALLEKAQPSEKEVQAAGIATVETDTKLRNLRLKFTAKLRGMLAPSQLEEFMKRRKNLRLPTRRR
jgi:Spy/CpxP family protein refolding chaperone